MLGAHLLLRLTAEGKNLRATYRSEASLAAAQKIFSFYHQDGQPLFERITWVKADLMDVTALDGAMAGATHLYHCAARISFEGNDAEGLVRDNTRTTANVVNAALAAGIKKMLHVSSVAALGRGTRQAMIDENSRWTESKANSAYARSKYLSELEVWRGMEEGLEAVIVNPSIILGPGDWREGSPSMFRTIAGGFKFYSHGINGFVDVRDVAEAMQRLMESQVSGERFVVVGENRSYREVFNKIADCLGVKRPTIEAKPWMGAIVWRVVKLKTALFGGKAMVTKETVHTSFQENRYSHQKIREKLGMDFRKMEESVEDFCGMYEKDVARIANPR